MSIFPLGNLIAITAVLVFPVGWLVLQVEGFYLTWRGRYEKELTIKYVRKNITDQIKNGKHEVDLSKIVSSSDYPNRIICCECGQEYDRLFDPFKFLKYIPCSHRRKQEREKITPPYVEGIENLIFFHEQAHSGYIRELFRYWHISFASAIGVVCGGIIASGVYLIVTDLGYSTYGWIIVFTLLGILLFIAGIQSYFRRREAIANEYLRLKLLIPQK